MKLVLLDKNLNDIECYDFLKNSDRQIFEQYTNVPDIDERSKKFSNNLDYTVSIFSPNNDLSDFYVSFLNKTALKFVSCDLTDIKGALVSDIFLPFNKNGELLKGMKEVYKTDVSQKFYLEYYTGEILYKRLNLTIIKIDDFIYILGKDETDYNIFAMEKNQFIENYPQAIAIIQDNKIIKCNKKYQEIEYPKTYNDIINKEIDYESLNITLEQSKQIGNTIKSISEQESYVKILPLEIKDNDKVIYFFNLNFIYIIYNDKPAIIVFFDDLTKETLYKEKLENALKETRELNSNLEGIQNASKTFISYTYDLENIYWTPEVYNILEVDKDYKNKDNCILRDFIPEKYLKQRIKILSKISPTNPNLTLIQKIKTQKGNIKYIKTVFHHDYDNNDNFIRQISFNQDVTKEMKYQKQLQKALKETKELNNTLEGIHKIQNASKTFMGYSYDLKHFEWTKEIEDILEINPEDYKDKEYNILGDFILEEDRKTTEQKLSTITPNNPEITFTQRLKTRKGKVKYFKTVIHREYDKDGKFIKSLSSNTDITKEINYQKQLKKALKEKTILTDNLERIQSSSKTFICYSDDLKNFSWTSEVYNILEVSKNYKNKNASIIKDFIQEEDSKQSEEPISTLSPINPTVTFTQKVITGKGNIKYIRTVMHQEYKNNKFIKRIGFNQDITEEVIYQKQLQTALNDKNILLKEVHHRVKNNLQIILSLIDLNINLDTDIKNILQNTQNRIYAMALIHEKIYGSDSLSKVNMKEYIESLVTSLIELYNFDINFLPDIDPLELNMEESIPLGLIINEMITNTIKYAFPDKKEGNLYIKFKKEGGKYTLIVQDDGIGLPPDIDIENLTSLGLIVITNLTIQIGGTLSLLDCEGTGYKIEF